MGNLLHIYTDGSYSKELVRSTWGFVVVDSVTDEVIHTASGKVTLPAFLEMWNVGGELFAALNVMKYLLNTDNRAIIYHDYEGVAHWVTGVWKTKKAQTKMYADAMKYCYMTGQVQFKWVKGHSGQRYNEMVDKLCTEEMRRD